jgi:hypothetical protein
LKAPLVMTYSSASPGSRPKSFAIYEAAGFEGQLADRAAIAVFTFVLGNALGPAAAASLSRKLGRRGGNAKESIREGMARAKAIAADFPRLRARLETPAAEYGAAPENTFEFGLRALLDGLEAKLTARRAKRRRSGRRAE